MSTEYQKDPKDSPTGDKRDDGNNHVVNENSDDNFDENPATLNNKDTANDDTFEAETPSPYPEPPKDYWDKWSQLITRYRLFIIVFYFCIILPFGMVSIPRFTDSTDSTFYAIPGTDGYDAEEVYEDAYGDDDTFSAIILLSQIDDFGESMIDEQSSLYNETKTFLEQYEVYAKGLDNVKTLEASSYYELVDMGLSTLALKSDIREDGRVQKFTLIYEIDGSTSDVHDFIDDIISYGDDNVPSSLSIGYTGNQFFQKDMSHSAEEDMKKTDTISLPLAMLVLGIVVKRIPLLIVPLIMMIMTMACWGIVMYPIALNLQVTQFTPSIMMSITVAMGIDYSLFLLTRCVKELSNHGEHAAIALAMKHSGHAILASGATMTVCLIGMTMLPLTMLASMGLGAGIAVISCLMVNLTLVPSLLHTKFGKCLLNLTNEKCWMFFKKCYKTHCRCCCSKTDTVTDTTTTDAMLNEDTLVSGNDTSGLQAPLLQKENFDTIDSPPTSADSLPRNVNHNAALHNSYWFRLGLKVTRSPTNHIILLLVFGLVILPCAIFAPQFNTSISIELMLSEDAPSMETYQTLTDTFGAGTQNPYKLVFDGSKTNTSITTSQGFDVMHNVINTMASTTPGVPLTAYSGISYLGGTEISYSYYQKAMSCGSDCDNDLLKTIVYLDELMTTENGATTFATVILPMDPFSEEGTDWLVDSRKVLDTMKDQGLLGPYEVVIYGMVADNYDAAEECWSIFPLMISITFIIVLILMGLFFRSIIVPLRSLVSIGSTILFSFGLTVLVYRYGILNWLGIRSLSSFSSSGDDSDGEISFIVPLMTFSMIVGLGLDYDVFLITRVLEFRLEGYDDVSTILLGMEGTGGIITAAGVIMVVAFGALLFSEMLLLNQFAFMLVSAVLLDTFVVRTIIVPIFLGYTAGWSWWPRILPPVDKNVVEEYYDAREEEVHLLEEHENAFEERSHTSLPKVHFF